MIKLDEIIGRVELLNSDILVSRVVRIFFGDDYRKNNGFKLREVKQSSHINSKFIYIFFLK